jgi:hypothetical protein
VDRLAFDPWTASRELAARAREGRAEGSDQPDPLAQYQVAQEVLRSRQDCLEEDGGGAVLDAVARCMSSGLTAPKWLAEAFLQRHALVRAAEVGTWDDAFGGAWPKGTRLEVERQSIRLRRVVHAAVLRHLSADPTCPVNRKLFAAIGASDGVHASGSKVERLYYQALDAGMPNPVSTRRGERNPQHSHDWLRTPAGA